MNFGRLGNLPHIVKISAKTEYACIAVMELAAAYRSGEPVQIRKIAEAHGIPSRFLVQILLQLKGAGFVTSTRGAAGGYRLAKAPAEISLGAVMAVVDGRSEAVTSNTQVNSPVSDVLLRRWQKISDVEREMLDAITFNELMDEAASQDESMYYI